MFDFQKEVVLNSLDDVKLIEAVPATGMPAKLQVRDGGEYFGKYIVDGKVFLTEAIEGNVFELEIPMKGFGEGVHYSITLELGTSGDYRFDMASGLYYYRKPILVDFIADTQKATAAKVAKIINASVLESNKFVKAETVQSDPVSAPNDYKVVVKGLDKALNIHSLDVCAYGDAKDGEIDGLLERNIYLASDLTAAGFKYTPNQLEVGTADYLLKNRRLQTYYNVRMTTPMADEMPIKGAKYAQFSFMYLVPRVGLGGLSAAGQVVHSSTMHTFYVKYTDADKSLVDAFKADFEGIGVAIEPINIATDHAKKNQHKHATPILPDAFPSSQDAKAAADIAANAAADEKVVAAVNATIDAVVDAHKDDAPNTDKAKKLAESKITK